MNKKLIIAILLLCNISLYMHKKNSNLKKDWQNSELKWEEKEETPKIEEKETPKIEEKVVPKTMKNCHCGPNCKCPPNCKNCN